MSRAPTLESAASSRAATLFALLGTVDLVLVVAGETVLLLLFMVGLYFWVLLVWLAFAAYATYLTWARTRNAPLRVLSWVA